jgi:hypothetical protein
MIFSPAIFPRSGFSAFARYTNSAFENYTTRIDTLFDGRAGNRYDKRPYGKRVTVFDR